MVFIKPLKKGNQKYFSLSGILNLKSSQMSISFLKKSLSTSNPVPFTSLCVLSQTLTTPAMCGIWLSLALVIDIQSQSEWPVTKSWLYVHC